MLNPQRMIDGEVFRLASENIHRHRDLFPVSPFFLFFIFGIIDIFTPDHIHRVIELNCLALAAIALFLARQLSVPLGTVLGLCVVRFLVTLLETQDGGRWLDCLPSAPHWSYPSASGLVLCRAVNVPSVSTAWTS